MPYKALSGLTYDSGDFTALMDEALEAADVAGFAAAARRVASGKVSCAGLGSAAFSK